MSAERVESALAWRDRLIDRYLLMAGEQDRAALTLFLLDGEDGMAAMSVQTAIRRAQAKVLAASETEKREVAG